MHPHSCHDCKDGSCRSRHASVPDTLRIPALPRTPPIIRSDFLSGPILFENARTEPTPFGPESPWVPGGTQGFHSPSHRLFDDRPARHHTHARVMNVQMAHGDHAMHRVLIHFIPTPALRIPPILRSDFLRGPILSRNLRTEPNPIPSRKSLRYTALALPMDSGSRTFPRVPSHLPCPGDHRTPAASGSA